MTASNQTSTIRGLSFLQTKMDFEDVEDMLFNAPGSWEDVDLWVEHSEDEDMLDIAGSECESDDDLFDVPIGMAAGSWRLLSSPLLTAADASLQQQHNASVDRNDTVSTVIDAGPAVVGKEESRDRFCDRSMRRSTY